MYTIYSNLERSFKVFLGITEKNLQRMQRYFNICQTESGLDDQLTNFRLLLCAAHCAARRATRETWNTRDRK